MPVLIGLGGTVALLTRAILEEGDWFSYLVALFPLAVGAVLTYCI